MHFYLPDCGSWFPEAYVLDAYWNEVLEGLVTLPIIRSCHGYQHTWWLGSECSKNPRLELDGPVSKRNGRRQQVRIEDSSKSPILLHTWLIEIWNNEWMIDQRCESACSFGAARPRIMGWERHRNPLVGSTSFFGERWIRPVVIMRNSRQQSALQAKRKMFMRLEQSRTPEDQ